MANVNTLFPSVYSLRYDRLQTSILIDLCHETLSTVGTT